MKNIKVAIVLMKGFDGCGVSRFAIEHQKELRKNGNICDIYSFNNKYVRSKSHGELDINYYDKFTDIDFSNYNIFILNSYEKDFNREDLEYYKSLKCCKVAMMHEIIRSNVSRIPNVWEWLKASDIISSFSYEMDFAKDLYKKLLNPKYFPFKMAMSNEEMDNLFNASNIATKSNSLIYYGRWTSMKDPHRLFEYKKINPNFNLHMIGIERSIGAFHDIFNNELCQNCNVSFLDSYDKFKDFKKDSDKVQVFPPASRNVALEILSNSKYGCSFYSLAENKINNLGNRMEYTQIEMSCVCLPVFDIDWGKNTFDIETGKSFYDIGDNAIYSDTKDLKSSLEEMINMSDEDYNRRRQNIFNLVKRNYGSTKNIDSFYDTIDKLINNIDININKPKTRVTKRLL